MELIPVLKPMKVMVDVGSPGTWKEVKSREVFAILSTNKEISLLVPDDQGKLQWVTNYNIPSEDAGGALRLSWTARLGR